jgi:TolC family type I secretion outer membrane protein
MMRVQTLMCAAITAWLIAWISSPLSAGGAEPIAPKPVPEVLTLENALIIALSNQPSLRVAAGNQAITEARVGQARSGYYPQITGRIAYQRATANIATSFGGGPITRRTSGESFGTYLNNVNLNQTIFDFGKIRSQVATAEYNLQAARSDTETALQTMVVNVQQSYYGLQQAQRLLIVSDEAVAQFQKHLDLAKGRFKVGVAPKIDVMTAEVDLSNARLNLINAKNNLSLARVTLNNAMGIVSPDQYRVEDPAPIDQYAVSQAEALDRAMRARPELIAQRALEQAAEAAIKTAQADYLPTVTGAAGYSYNGQEFPLVWNWNVLGSFNIPIFSGFLTKQQVAEARANLLKTKANGDVLKQTVLAEVSQAYLNLEATKERLRVTAVTVIQAKERMALVEGRYRAGLATAVEVTDAEVALVNAQVNDVVAMSNYQAAKAQLERAMGTTMAPSYAPASLQIGPGDGVPLTDLSPSATQPVASSGAGAAAHPTRAETRVLPVAPARPRAAETAPLPGGGS